MGVSTSSNVSYLSANEDGEKGTDLVQACDVPNDFEKRLLTVLVDKTAIPLYLICEPIARRYKRMIPSEDYLRETMGVEDPAGLKEGIHAKAHRYKEKHPLAARAYGAVGGVVVRTAQLGEILRTAWRSRDRSMDSRVR